MEGVKAFIAEIEGIAAKNSSIMEDQAADAVHCVWHNIARAKDVIFNCFRVNQGMKDRLCFDCLLMLTNVLSDVIDATISTCEGFWRGPGTVLRSVWEDLACVVAIKHDREKYERFKVGKFSAKEAITPAKIIFPEFGKHYGLFSNRYTHLKYDSLGRSGTTFEKSSGVSVIKTLDPEKLPLGLLLECARTARYAGAIAELFASRLLDEFYYWRKDSADHLQEHLDTAEDTLIKGLMKRVEISLAKRKRTIEDL